MALFRHEAGAKQPAHQCRLSPTAFPRMEIRSSTVTGYSPDIASKQLALPVAGNTGDCQYLAGTDEAPRLERHGEGCARAATSGDFQWISPLAPQPSWTTLATSLPTIIRASEPVVSLLGSQAPVTGPCRERWRGRRCAALLQAMADIEDRATLGSRLEQGLEQPVSLLRRQHRVGSSRMMSFGFCSSARTISMRWRSPTDKSATWAFGSSGRP